MYMNHSMMLNRKLEIVDDAVHNREIYIDITKKHTLWLLLGPLLGKSNATNGNNVSFGHYTPSLGTGSPVKTWNHLTSKPQAFEILEGHNRCTSTMLLQSKQSFWITCTRTIVSVAPTIILQEFARFMTLTPIDLSDTWSKLRRPLLESWPLSCGVDAVCWTTTK